MLRQSAGATRRNGQPTGSAAPRALLCVLVFVAISGTIAGCGIKGPLRPAPKATSPATPPPIDNPAAPPPSTSPALPPPSSPPGNP